MTSPMQVLEDTPKVWLVFYSKYDENELQAAFRTKEGAEKYVESQRDTIIPHLYIVWEVLRD